MRRFISSLAFALAAAIPLWPSAAAAGDSFTVGGIHVDASGPSASVAQLSAMAQGRPKAWAILYKRVTKPQDWGRLPKLDDASLQRIIRAFAVTNEKRSTTRYVADVSYTFSPEGVARVLQGGGIALTQVQAKRILLVPFAPNYSGSSMWAAAFSGTRYAGSFVPFALPGGATDQATLSALNFDTANWMDVEPAAARIHATEVVLVKVMPAPGHLTVTMKRLGIGQLPTKSSLDVPLLPGGAAGTYSSAADAAVHAIEDMWKAHPVETSQAGHLTADVKVSSLVQWGALQAQMSTVPNVTRVDVLAMDIGETRVSIAYLGSAEQLQDALSAQGIFLTKMDGEWLLSGSGAP
jgi:hypothetical protein